MSLLNQPTTIRYEQMSPQNGRKNRRQTTTVSPIGRRLQRDSSAKSGIGSFKNIQMSQKNQRIRELQTIKQQGQKQVQKQEQQIQKLTRELEEIKRRHKAQLKDKEQKARKNLSEVVDQYRMQIQQLSGQRQDQEEFFQRQSQLAKRNYQLLEDKNRESLARNRQLLSQVQHLSRQSSVTQAQIERLKAENKGTNEKYQQMQTQKNSQIEKLQERDRKTGQQWRQEKLAWKKDLQNMLQRKEQQKKQSQQKQQLEFKSLQAQRQSQNAFRDNELAELRRLLQTQRLKSTHALEAQRLRYDHILQTQALKAQKTLERQARSHSQLLHVKQSSIHMLNRDIQQLKRSLHQSSNQVNKLNNIVNDMNNQLKQMQFQLKQCDQLFLKQKHTFSTTIQKLKQQIKMNQLNFIRQRDRNQSISGNNAKLQHVAQDRQSMIAEITQLRHILADSSTQIQMCRQRFLVIERQNKRVRSQIDRLNAENNALLHLRRQLQDEAIKWRQSYLRVAH